MSHSMQAGKQEEDKIQSGPIFVIAACVCAVMVLTFIGVRNYATGHAAHIVAETAAKVPMMPNGEPLENSPIPQFGMLHQTLFDSVSDARDLRTISEQKLSSYKWIENGKTAQIPVARAMEIMIAQAAQQPAPQQPQQTAPQQAPQPEQKSEQKPEEKK